MDLQLLEQQLEYLKIICKLQQKIKCSFKEWFEFIFPIIEGKKLIHQEATDKLLQCWQDIYDGKYHDISKYIDITADDSVFIKVDSGVTAPYAKKSALCVAKG